MLRISGLVDDVFSHNALAILMGVMLKQVVKYSNVFARSRRGVTLSWYTVVTNCTPGAKSVCDCLVGSRPSDHYFRSVCWFVCLSVCLFACAEFISPSFDPISIKLGHLLWV